MIHVTGMGGKEFYLNPDHFEKIESVPDTVITLINGNSYMVREEAGEVIESIIKFRLRYMDPRRLFRERKE